MAADKKFLGLGFSFKATDKGLEKKLVNVHKHLGGISSKLKDIGGAGKKASKGLGGVGEKIGKPGASAGLGGMKGPSGPKQWAGVSDEKSTTGQAKKTTAPKNIGTKSFQKLYKVIQEGGKRADDVAGTFGALGKVIKPQLMEHLIANMRDLNVSFDENGKLTEDSRNRIISNASTFVKSNNAIMAGWKKASKVFEGVRNYFNDIGNSAKNFLSTVGIDFSKIIPPQLTAALGVVGSVLKPIKDLPKMLMGKIEKNQRDKMINSLNNLLKMNEESFEKQKDMNISLGKGGKKTNVISLLKKIFEISGEEEEKKGILGTIMGWLAAGLAALGTGLLKIPGVSALSGMFKNLGSGIMKVTKSLGGRFLNVFKGIGPRLLSIINAIKTPFVNAFEFLWNPIRMLGQRLLTFSGGIGTAIAAIAVFGTAIAGFVTGVWSTVTGGFKWLGTSIMDLAGSIGRFFGALNNWVSAFVSQSPMLKSAIDSITSVFGSVGTGIKTSIDFVTNAFMTFGNGILTVFKMIFEGWKNIGGLVGNAVGGAADWLGDKVKGFGSMFDSAADKLNKSAEKMKPKAGVPPKLQQQTKTPGGIIAGGEKGKVAPVIPIGTEKEKQARLKKVPEKDVTKKQLAATEQTAMSNMLILDQLQQLNQNLSKGGGNQKVVIGADANRMGITMDKRSRAQAERSGKEIT